MRKLIGSDGIYPSRSELIRCAIRESLMKMLEFADKIETTEKNQNKDKNQNIVKIPGGKVYTIIKRLI
jgi:Arc/MetJ-type ribon-helix-helix transcriptional regulator